MDWVFGCLGFLGFGFWGLKVSGLGSIATGSSRRLQVENWLLEFGGLEVEGLGFRGLGV